MSKRIIRPMQIGFLFIDENEDEYLESVNFCQCTFLNSAGARCRLENEEKWRGCWQMATAEVKIRDFHSLI